MTALKELEIVALRDDLPDSGLVVSDVGTIVFVDRSGEAYEVEFTDADGTTLAMKRCRLSRLHLFAAGRFCTRVR